MDADESLEERLRELGRKPLDGATRSRTLTAMATAEPRRRWSRGAVAAAAIAGFFVGSFGLASAGALPSPAQDAAHSVLSHVGVDVPPGHNRYNDPTTCPGGPYENHGAYVRSHKDDPNAGASPCGKPVQAVGHDSNGSDESEAPESESDDAGASHGKGKGKGGGKGEDDNMSSDASNAAPTSTPAPTTAPDATTVPAPTSVPGAASSSSEQSSTASNSDATGS